MLGGLGEGRECALPAGHHLLSSELSQGWDTGGMRVPRWCALAPRVGADGQEVRSAGMVGCCGLWFVVRNSKGCDQCIDMWLRASCEGGWEWGVGKGRGGSKQNHNKCQGMGQCEQVGMWRDGVTALSAFMCRVLLKIFVQLKSTFPKVCL